MIETPDISRAPKEWTSALQEIGAATTSSTLAHMGIRSPFMVGPVARTPGKAVAGPALTLQCMPQREDIFDEGEYTDPETQLHRHVLYHTQPGDIVVVDARGDLKSGIFGDMMLTYFKGTRRSRRRDRRLHPRLPEREAARPRPVGERGDAELSRPDRHLPICGQCADRLRRCVRDARRHHRGGRRRRCGRAR